MPCTGLVGTPLNNLADRKHIRSYIRYLSASRLLNVSNRSVQKITGLYGFAIYQTKKNIEG